MITFVVLYSRRFKKLRSREFLVSSRLPTEDHALLPATYISQILPPKFLIFALFFEEA